MHHPKLIKQITYHTVTILLLTTLAVCTRFILSKNFANSDFRSFFAAAQTLKYQPTHLFTEEAQLAHQNQLIDPTQDNVFENQLIPYFNPPHFLLPLQLLSDLPPQQAYRISQLLLLFCTAASIILLAKMFPPKNRIITILLAFSFPAVYTALIQTQSSPLTLLLYTATLYLLIKKKWLLAGLIAGLLTYKPQLAIILYLYLITLKNKHLTVGLITSATFSVVLSYYLVGPHLFSLPEFIKHYDNLDSTGPLHRASLFAIDTQINHFIPEYKHFLIGISSSLFILYFTFKNLKPTAKSDLNQLPYHFMIIVSATLLTAVHVHYHDTILLTLLLFVATRQYPLHQINLFIAATWFILLLAIFSPFHPQPLYFLPTLIILIIWYALIKHPPHQKNNAHTNQLSN